MMEHYEPVMSFDEDAAEIYDAWPDANQVGRGDTHATVAFLEELADGGPALELAIGTGRMALRLAARGYQVTEVDLVPEMIAHARQKGSAQGVSAEWGVADARTVQLGRQFRFAYMVGNAFQFFHTRAD